MMKEAIFRTHINPHVPLQDLRLWSNHRVRVISTLRVRSASDHGGCTVLNVPGVYLHMTAHSIDRTDYSTYDTF